MTNDKRPELVEALMAWTEARLRLSEWEQQRRDAPSGAGRTAGDEVLHVLAVAAEQSAAKQYRRALADYIESRGCSLPVPPALPRGTVRPRASIQRNGLRGPASYGYQPAG